jgi:hypothetical protein
MLQKKILDEFLLMTEILVGVKNDSFHDESAPVM